MTGGSLRLIESPQNPRVKLWTALSETRGIKKHGAFLLAGRKTVPEALKRHAAQFSAVLASREADIAALKPPAGLECFVLSRALFETLDSNGTGFPLLVGRVPDMPAADLTRVPKGLELVCALGDPANLGAVLRSAAAFGARRIVLMEAAAHPFHPKALRAAANAQFELQFLKGPGWPALNTARGPLAALDGEGEDIGAFHWPRDIRLVLGEEGLGLPAGLKARRLAIPTTGAVESLNATVAASLAMQAHFGAMRKE
ncbi:MAG: RNA methyltransferase [Parvibaculum sp.]|uniref:TrmH family RNA methyltransferase n=1 Tax=Parvibaculum sp. TaxID=2024848 RepID=UPI0027176E50|nr:RNA methyltransferase [Parvibaculum sp.]MDO8838914.1 RNA methyltransferase [Parvibaculum sp.]